MKALPKANSNLGIMCLFFGWSGGKSHQIAEMFKDEVVASDWINPVELSGLDDLDGFSLWNESVKKRKQFCLIASGSHKLVSSIINAYNCRVWLERSCNNCHYKESGINCYGCDGKENWAEM